MKNLALKIGVCVILVTLSGCIAGDPLDAPEGGYYKSKPVTYSAPEEVVWDATLEALREQAWDIRSIDKELGRIVLKTAYVYNPSFGVNKRVYVEPSRDEAANSRIKPYLRRISYYKQIVPLNPLYARERLEVFIKSLSPEETQVRISYIIWPYYGSNRGYIGSVRSKGVMETAILDHIKRALDGGGGSALKKG